MADFFSIRITCNSALRAAPPRGRPTPGTPRGATGALREAENDPPRPLRRSRPWDGFGSRYRVNNRLFFLQPRASAAVVLSVAH